MWLGKEGGSHRWDIRSQRLVLVCGHRLASVTLLTMEEWRKIKITVFPLTENTSKQKRSPLFMLETAVGIIDVTMCQIKGVCNLKEQGYTTQSDTDALRCIDHSFKCAIIQSPYLRSKRKQRESVPREKAQWVRVPTTPPWGTAFRSPAPTQERHGRTRL